MGNKTHPPPHSRLSALPGFQILKAMAAHSDKHWSKSALSLNLRQVTKLFLAPRSSQESRENGHLEYFFVAVTECLSCTRSSERASYRSPLLPRLTQTEGVLPSRMLKAREPLLLCKRSISNRVGTQAQG